MTIAEAARSIGDILSAIRDGPMVLQDTVCEISETMTDNERREFLRWLYWSAPEVKASTLTYCDPKKGFMAPVADPVSCVVCGSVFYVALTSRSRGGLYGAPSNFCPACEANRSKNVEISMHNRRVADNLSRGQIAPIRQYDGFYSDYLRSERWLSVVRPEALDRAGHKCQLCSSEYRLRVHHNSYDRVGNERPTDVVVLCQMCHETFHGYAALSWGMPPRDPCDETANE